MKIAVLGLWHLGCVTAACLAKTGQDVLAYDSNQETIHHLLSGKAPLFEPGLDDLLLGAMKAKRLAFTADASELSEADVLWVTFDTPVDDEDIADVEFVLNEIRTVLPFVKENVLILISSQLPVGSTRKLQQECSEKWHEKKVSFAYLPENLRLGKAIDIFLHPDRIIVGFQNEADKNRIHPILKPLSENIIWMSVESAEMTKHALNSFLATSVIFINELASLCERVGANAYEVERGLKSEERIGPKAYLRPGAAIAGGTLARDVNYLIQIGHEQALSTPLFSALLTSNHTHKQWSCRRITELLNPLLNKTVAVLGLAYKPGTDTLRRSTAIETCQWLKQQGVKVVAYDPIITQLPSDELHQGIQLKSSLEEALQGADAVVLATPGPQFSALTAEQLLGCVKQPFVFDASGFLQQQLGHDKRINYYSVGRQT
jgi:UDPglucose 6-dehydrogenase